MSRSTGRRWQQAWLPAALVTVIASSAGATQEPVDGGTPIGDARCLTCHAALTQRTFHHPRLMECSSCHVTTAKPGPCRDNPDRGWRLRRGATELCKSCHELTGKTELHGTIRNSGCRSCHDPHSSDTPKLLKRPLAAQLCRRCHQLTSAPYGHAPVLAGDCTECHAPHVGEGEPLLREPREKVCFRCHQLPGPDSKLPFAHSPVKAGLCLECHRAHGSAKKHLLLGTTLGSCLTCHDARTTAVDGVAPADARVDLQAKGGHQSLNARCEHCHVLGHASAAPKLLRGSQAALCGSCHASQVAERVPLHPSKVGQCTLCHQSHSSPLPKLLRTAPGQGQCFGCHEDEVLRRSHVHQPVAEGNCAACHDVHGTSRPFGLLAEGVELCLSCHAPKRLAQLAKHQVISKHGCVGCHDPHGSANPALLIKPVNELCGSCHPKQREGTHVAAGVDHRLSGVADPSAEGHQLSCTSCHHSHGAAGSKLLDADPARSCRTCHTDVAGKYSRKDLLREAKK